MKRQERYPETKTFHYYNANPKNRITGDCVTRALCVALDIPYNDCVMQQAILQCETGYDNADSKGFAKFLELKGWIKHKQPKKFDGTKFTGKEFCELLQTKFDTSKIVANIGGNHTIAIVNGKVWDIWDSTDGCIGNYWTKR